MPSKTADPGLFEKLLVLLENGPESAEADVAHEHVLGARIALLGGMPMEYEMEIENSRQALQRIGEKDLREPALELLKEANGD